MYNDNMPNAAIYARVSRNDLHDGHGVNAQLKQCRALAKREGLTVIDEFVDDDTSAFSGKRRAGYEGLLERLDDIDVIVAWSPDRITRRTAELVDLIDRLESSSVGVVTVQGGVVDLSTAGGRMAAKLAGVIAEHESELKSERNRLRHATIAAEGRPNGGTRPYGFEDDRIMHHPAEVAVIRQSAARVLAGESLSAIVRDLNARGVPTARGTTWRVPTLRTILIAPRTAGLRDHRGALHEAVWAAILTPEQRAEITATVADPHRSKPRGRPRRLLSGLAVCGKCGAPLRSRIRTTTGRVEYVCLSQPGVDACGKLGVQGDPLEDLVVSAVLRSLDASLIDDADDHDVNMRPAIELAALDARADEFARMAATGEITPATFARMTSALDTERATLMAATAEHVTATRRSRMDPARIVDEWDTMTVEQQRCVLDLVLARVIVAGGRRPVAERVDLIWAV